MAQNMEVVKNKGNSNMEAVGKLATQTDQSVKLIEDWRAKLATEDIPNKVLYLAQADHLLWKKRLLDMVVGRSNTKASELTDHTMCRLGKWYYQSADDAVKSKASFSAIEQPHIKVHHHGIEAAKCFERGKTQEGMEHYRILEEASRQVIENLQKLID